MSAAEHTYDVVVLGAGPVGQTAAERARAAGLTVAMGVSELLHSATIAVAGRVPIDQLWHAVPCFPTISEVWLRLLEAYGDYQAASTASSAE